MTIITNSFLSSYVMVKDFEKLKYTLIKFFKIRLTTQYNIKYRNNTLISNT